MLSCVFVVVTLGLQIAYPLVDDVPRVADNPVLAGLTIATVWCFAAASVLHAVWFAGLLRAGAVVVAAMGCGLCAEVVGVATGFPFGSYFYQDHLGWRVFDVPVIIGAAWLMMTWPTYVLGLFVARRLGCGRWCVVVVGAWTMVGWDLFLDPQMVAAGQWVWLDVRWALPGLPQIPLSNYVGWCVVAVVLHGVIAVVVSPAWVPGVRRSVWVGAVPWVLLMWTWLGSTLAHVVWFGQGVAAGYGFVVMGVGCGAAIVLAVMASPRFGERGAVLRRLVRTRCHSE